MTREELNKSVQIEVDYEKQQEKKQKIIKACIKLSIFLVVFSIIFYAYTTYISTITVGVREYRIKNEKIPNSFNGLKVVQFSDLHFGSTMFNDNFKNIVKLINERKPDIVVFTGDLIYKKYKLQSKEQEELIDELKSINASLGKYAILGDEDNEKVSTIFNQSNFTVLRNEYELLYKNDDNPILLIGTYTNEIDVEKAFGYFNEANHNANIFTMTLIHKPDTFNEINSSHHSDLYFAGHSHNGNVRIPFKNYPLFKVEGAKEYNQDYYKVDNSDLYISSGLGTPNGIRLFCRPTISFYRLSNK